MYEVPIHLYFIVYLLVRDESNMYVLLNSSIQLSANAQQCNSSRFQTSNAINQVSVTWNSPKHICRVRTNHANEI